MLLSLLLLRIGKSEIGYIQGGKKNIYILLNHNKISRMIFALIILACIVCRNRVFEVITISSCILQENEMTSSKFQLLYTVID